MSTTQRLGGNLIAIYASQVGLKLLAFIWLIAVAHHLGAEDYGKLVTAISITSILGILIDFGLGGLITREVARRKDLALSYLRAASRIKGILSVLLAASTVFVVRGLGYAPETEVVVYILSAFVILSNLAAIPRSLYFAYERIAYPAAFAFLSKVAAVGCGFIFLYADLGLYWIAGAMVIEGAMDLILEFVFLRKLVGETDQRRERRSLVGLARAALPLALASMMGILYFSIDTVMLSKMKGDLAVAWYNGAFRLMAALMFLPEAFANTVYPVLSRMHSRKDSLLRWLNPSFRALFLGGLAIGVLFLFSPALVIRSLYPPDFLPATPVLRLMGIAIVPIFVNVLLGWTLNALNRERERFIIALGGVVLNVAANAILIPRFAHQGAAAATLLTQIGVSAAYLAFLWRLLTPFPGVSFFVRAGAALGVTALAAIALVPRAPLVAAPVTVIVFLGASVAARAVTTADIQLAKNLAAEIRDGLRSSKNNRD